MHEVEPALLSTRAGGVVFVDGEDECRAEAGELQGFDGRLVEIGTVGEAGVEQLEDADLTVWKSVSRACVRLFVLSPKSLSLTRQLASASPALAPGRPRRAGRRHHRPCLPQGQGARPRPGRPFLAPPP